MERVTSSKPADCSKDVGCLSRDGVHSAETLADFTLQMIHAGVMEDAAPAKA